MHAWGRLYPHIARAKERYALAGTKRLRAPAGYFTVGAGARQEMLSAPVRYLALILALDVRFRRCSQKAAVFRFESPRRIGAGRSTAVGWFGVGRSRYQKQGVSVIYLSG